ncbi:MAG TPA: sensor histidine kinase [Thermoanaerobaculia bacterium]|jgi:signal transduction histidine kinase|nr:sensor histidine kinase [Thermoanaerobaculia bacterium]
MDFEHSAHSRGERLSREMLKIAAWPRDPLQDADALLARLLAQVAGLLEAPRVLLAWEETDEPWLHLAHRRDGRIERFREAPSGEPGEPVEESLRRRFTVAEAAAWPVRGEIVQGSLFVFNDCGDRGPAFEPDHLVLGEIAAQRVAAELDQFYLTRRLRTAAVTEERVRLACDLHDGMLQSLTGTALQLQALARLMEDDLPAARTQLREVQRLIAADQRDLRFFIEELKPMPRALGDPQDFRDRLADLADRLKRLWDLNVSFDFDLADLDARPSDAFLRQLYRLLREALFNVARHAEASAVRVEVSRQDQALNVTVTDDGRGFPFIGRYDHEELNRRKLGPVSLKERISALGGSLAIDSNPGLTRLEMRLPARGGTR